VVVSSEYDGVLGWRDELAGLQGRLGWLFRRVEARRQAGRYLEGLLSAVERKNGWQLAEQISDARPWRTQRVLSRTRWDAAAARDLCREYVVEHLGVAEGVLVVDETDFLKKGDKACPGTGRGRPALRQAQEERQYSGTAGRIENCQIGVFLGCASDRGHALIDRELYLPKEWAEDDTRRAGAEIPPAVPFATKPQLAERMIARAIAAGVPPELVEGRLGGGRRGLRFGPSLAAVSRSARAALCAGGAPQREAVVGARWPSWSARRGRSCGYEIRSWHSWYRHITPGLRRGRPWPYWRSLFSPCCGPS
jgi:hypothetical protein